MDFYWAIEQLLSYGPFAWIGFISIAAGAAFLGRWWGIIAGQFVVAMLVGYLDVVYQSQHATEMDMDAVFDLGMMARMLLINMVLLPISAVALFVAIRRRKRIKVSETVSDETIETIWPPTPKA